MENPIIDALFATKAIRVCEPDAPFWYTSGTLGPFYINTHFLFGSEGEASDLLLLIEEAAYSDRITFTDLLLKALLRQYDKCATYRMVIDMIVEKASELSFDFISGGERRDFFFSILPAYFLKKPHLSIFKDMQAVYTNSSFTETVPVYEVALAGKRALHIVDLVTEASSYTRAWIPVIREFGGVMEETIAVVNRKQGGEQILLQEGVKLISFADINKDLFQAAEAMGVISVDQRMMVESFIDRPQEFMAEFLKTHPSFIPDEIAKGGKARERAELAISKGYAKGPANA
jgi:orotate phosphoribosyltransferase